MLRYYNVYRKDKTNTGCGVFIVVSHKLISSTLEEFHTDHEAIWVQIKEQKYPSITRGAYYQPPKSDLRSPQSFSNTVNSVTCTTRGRVIPVWDFNLPGIHWSKNT